MDGLRFRFDELQSELNAIRSMARDFVTPETYEQVLPAYVSELRSIRDDGDSKSSYPWEVKRNRPIVTEWSRSYTGVRAQRSVRAEISSKWDIRPIGNKSRKGGSRLFALAGVASTKVTLYRKTQTVEKIGMWRMEIADMKSPGCFFHVQLGADDNTSIFPRYLEIPRLPGLVATPPLVLEFVLAELFQDEWAKKAEADGPSEKEWRKVQWERSSKFLRWQTIELNKGKGKGSPWLILKRAKPAEGQFCD